MSAQKSLNFTSNLMGSQLPVSEQEYDLEAIVDSLMNMLTQRSAAVGGKVNSMLVIIRKRTEYKTAHTIVPLYKSIVRPKALTPGG